MSRNTELGTQKEIKLSVPGDESAGREGACWGEGYSPLPGEDGKYKMSVNCRALSSCVRDAGKGVPSLPRGTTLPTAKLKVAGRELSIPNSRALISHTALDFPGLCHDFRNKEHHYPGMTRDSGPPAMLRNVFWEPYLIWFKRKTWKEISRVCIWVCPRELVVITCVLGHSIESFQNKHHLMRWSCSVSVRLKCRHSLVPLPQPSDHPEPGAFCKSASDLW